MFSFLQEEKNLLQKDTFYKENSVFLKYFPLSCDHIP